MYVIIQVIFFRFLIIFEWIFWKKCLFLKDENSKKVTLTYIHSSHPGGSLSCSYYCFSLLTLKLNVSQSSSYQQYNFMIDVHTFLKLIFNSWYSEMEHVLHFSWNSCDVNIRYVWFLCLPSEDFESFWSGTTAVLQRCLWLIWFKS